jgi:hypothetical protein
VPIFAAAFDFARQLAGDSRLQELFVVPEDRLLIVPQDVDHPLSELRGHLLVGAALAVAPALETHVDTVHRNHELAAVAAETGPVEKRLHVRYVAAEMAHKIYRVRMERLQLEVGGTLRGVLDPHCHVNEEQVAQTAFVHPLPCQLGRWGVFVSDQCGRFTVFAYKHLFTSTIVKMNLFIYLTIIEQCRYCLTTAFVR